MAHRVLHITNWYPGPFGPTETPFVRAQFEALAAAEPGCHRLIHLQVRPGGRLPRLRWGKTGPNQSYLLLQGPFTHSRLQEGLTALLQILLRFALLLQAARWHEVHLHIAWPLLRFPRLVRLLWGPQVVLSEHWSAYRRTFNLPEGSKGHLRLRRMFDPVRSLVVVSHALGRDITRFTARDDLDIRVVPNVVDPALFCPPQGSAGSTGSTGSAGGQVGLMVATWAPIKRPFLMLEALRALEADHPALRLRIIGDGAQLRAMQAFVQDHALSDRVTFLGRMDRPAIAAEMRRADFFAHASEYETFSVVCAEALCTGLPLIASDVGGVPEVVGQDGVLVENTEAAWRAGLERLLQAPVSDKGGADKGAIAARAAARFNPAVVGQALAAVHGAREDAEE